MNATVVITTYNRPRYLRKVIEGYLSQTRLPDEMLIADDGSLEETASMVEAIRDRSAVEIGHVWHEDDGFRAAGIRNMAMAGSKGDYLILADDDSVPDSRLVEDHLKQAEEGFFIQGHRVLLGAEVSENVSADDLSPLKMLKFAVRGQAGNWFNSLRLPMPLIKLSRSMKGIRSCNISFYKKDIIAVNGFNEDFTGWGKEDSELAARLYKYGLKRKDVKFRACCYHLHHGRYSTDRLERNIALLKMAEKDNGYVCSNG